MRKSDAEHKTEVNENYNIVHQELGYKSDMVFIKIQL